MKTQYIPWIIIAVLALLLWFKGCEKGEDDGIDITIPEQPGSFEPQKPIYIDRTDTVFITKWKEIKIKTPNPVNDSLAIAYQKVSDSLERYKMFLNAIQIRNFENIFEDDFVKITTTGKVQGELKSIKNDYLIKERKINVDVPETFLRGLIGFEIGNTTTISDFRYKASFGLQNNSGNIYRLGYSLESMNHYIYLGYELQLFNWKK